MSNNKKRKIQDEFEPQKKAAVSFKTSWLEELVETETVDAKIPKAVKLGYIFKYDERDGVVCKFCAEAKSSCDFATGKVWNQWKIDYLKRHLSQKVHLESISKLKRMKSGSGINSLLTESTADREMRLESNERQRTSGEQIMTLIDDVVLAISMNASMNSVQLIHNHMAKYVKIPENWRSKNYAFEFVESIDEIVKDTVMSEIRESEFHTLIVDESTDISVTKMLIVYIKYRPPTEQCHKTYFAGIIKITACDAQSIFDAIKKFYLDNNLDLQKIVMFTSDGASVMLGKRNGVVAKLRAVVPHLMAQHCVAHREDLGIDDAWKHIALMKDIELLLRTVYTTFCRSSGKKSDFEKMCDVANHDAISFRPLNEVRWMSRHFAVKPLVRNYNMLIEYYQKQIDEDGDPIAKFCVKKLKDPQVHVAVLVLNDVLTELSELCCNFQRSCITTIEAVQLAKAKINKLRSQYLNETVNWSSEVSDLLSLDRYADADTASILRFIERVCDHLQERFPEGELEEWIAFDHDAIKVQTRFDFGQEDISKLVAKYEHFFESKSKNIRSLVIAEYNEFKFVLKEKLKSGTLKTFADIVSYALGEEKFSKLAKLIDICGTFQASSADAERGFSLMNNIKTKSRNRLEVDHLDKLMRIKFYLTSGQSIDLDSVYKCWKGNKTRRQKISNFE